MLQQRVASFHLHSKLVEILQPPHTRSRAGSWLLAVEYLLLQLPPQDLSSSIQAVRTPVCSPCLGLIHVLHHTCGLAETLLHD